MRPLHTLARLLVPTAGVVGLSMIAVAPATAGPTSGTETEDGYGAGVSVTVNVTGDVSQSRRARIPGPPPLCYWAPLDGPADPSDPESVGEWWHEQELAIGSGHAAEGRLAMRDGAVQEAKDRVADGEELTFYRLHINDHAPEGRDWYDTTEKLAAAGCGAGTRPGRFGPVLTTITFFETGNPPAPVVDPETLARYAYEVMDLVAPELDWNPKARHAGGGSLVYLPTWLWVDDAAAVDVRSVTASIGAVSATVTAETGGVSVVSPAGATECSAAQAATPYSSNVAESNACTLTFLKGSRGYANGFPVEASTVWNATWTSSTGAGGELASRTENATTLIPVAESQALVTSTR